jgi:hypothetical protein
MLCFTFHQSEKLFMFYFSSFVQEVIQEAVTEILKDRFHMKYVRLMDGYRRFDPTRGMDYKLDILCHDPVEGEIIHRFIIFYCSL